MYQLGRDDIALMFFCGEDKDGKWNGSFDIKMYCDYENKHGKQHVDDMKRLMGLLTTCVQLIAEEDNFKHDELESKVKDNPKIISRKGNVIKVDWGQI